MTLLELFQLLRKHLKLVIALPIACALAMGAFSFVMMGNTYTASVSMYVLSQSAQGENNAAIQYNDLSASQMLTNDVSQLIKSERVVQQTAKDLGMSVGELESSKIEVTSSTTTRLITIAVTSDSPQSAAAVANGIARTTNSVAQEIMPVEAVNLIDEAEVPQAPSGPPRLMYTAVAFLAGIFIAAAIVVVMDMVNTRIRKPEEIEELLGVPVIGRIPTIK